LGRLSAKVPPAIARPEVGTPIGLDEFVRAYEEVERAACEAHAGAAARGVPSMPKPRSAAP
jgi:hypothetical protein